MQACMCVNMYVCIRPVVSTPSPNRERPAIVGGSSGHQSGEEAPPSWPPSVQLRQDTEGRSCPIRGKNAFQEKTQLGCATDHAADLLKLLLGRRDRAHGLSQNAGMKVLRQHIPRREISITVKTKTHMFDSERKREGHKEKERGRKRAKKTDTRP